MGKNDLFSIFISLHSKQSVLNNSSTPNYFLNNILYFYYILNNWICFHMKYSSIFHISYILNFIPISKNQQCIQDIIQGLNNWSSLQESKERRSQNEQKNNYFLHHISCNIQDSYINYIPVFGMEHIRLTSENNYW